MRIKRRRHDKLLIPLASMGDIAFLLIIFFMVTTNFVKEAHLPITQPSSPDLSRLRQGQVSVTVDQNGNIYLQGRRTHIDSLTTQVRALTSKRASRVMLKVDRDVPHAQYGPVMAALSKASVNVAVVGQLIRN